MQGGRCHAVRLIQTGFGAIGHFSIAMKKSVVTVQYRTVIWYGIGRFRVRPCTTYVTNLVAVEIFPTHLAEAEHTAGLCELHHVSKFVRHR